MDDTRLALDTAGQGVVLEYAKAAGEGGVLGIGDVLVAQEQHLVFEQQGPDFGEQAVVPGRFGQVHIFQFSAQGAGKGYNFHLASPFYGPVIRVSG
jgi:hypothetical protein